MAPPAFADSGHGVKFLPWAAVVDVAVDKRRPAKRLAVRRIEAAAAGPGPRLLLVGPVDALHMECLDEAGRQMDVGMPVPAPRFEHADTGAGIFAEAVGEHAARGARAHDHIIERFHITGSFSVSA